MGNTCKKESCWLRQKFLSDKHASDLMQYNFAPKSPDEWKFNPNEWLTSLDIDHVMKQYERTYDTFIFLGPSPIDFDKHKLYGECVWEELCKFDLKDYIKSGKTKIGIVFNTDPHYLEGSHWISLFIDVKNGKIFFFDSNGDKIPKEIMRLVNRIKRQGKALNIQFSFDQNHPKEHQKKNSECGMYSLYFIIQMLKGEKDAKFFKKQTIKDTDMETLRDVYFNKDL